VSDVHPGADRHLWETRLAVLERELASRPLESISDLLRLGEKVVAAAGIDVRAGSNTVPGAADDAFERAARLGRVSGLVTALSRRARVTRSVAPGRVTVIKAQGAYYVASGLWAVVDREGFEKVTGRKTDYWLVRTVGLLAAAIGLTLLTGARNGRPSSETKVLAIAAGASFTVVDLVSVAIGRISPIYLGDVAVHGLLAGLALTGSLERL
jgi:hypothetical protein